MVTNAEAPWPVEVRLALQAGDLHGARAKLLTLDAKMQAKRPLGAFVHRILTGDRLPPLDPAKGWDAANLVDLLQDAPQTLRVLDCGACNSPVPPALTAMGFSDVHGIDVDPHVTASIGTLGRVTYSCQDMQSTAYDSESFDVVTTGSTIEHGVDWSRFLAEAARLLKPGGLLYVSTDLVADGSDTSDASAFGFPWNPLQPSSLADIAKLFVEHGFLEPEIPQFELPDKLPVTFLGRQLGFIAFVTAKL